MSLLEVVQDHHSTGSFLRLVNGGSPLRFSHPIAYLERVPFPYLESCQRKDSARRWYLESRVAHTFENPHPHLGVCVVA